MSISREHIYYYTKIFALEGFVRDPVLVFGVQDCAVNKRAAIMRLGFRMLRLWISAAKKGFAGGIKWRYVWNVPVQYCRPTFKEILNVYGAETVRTLDAFDRRADIIHDMNLPIDCDLDGKFNTIIDIGSLEHVFDTRQCLSNLFKMLKVGGHIFLHNPCYGYYAHGFYTFSPECIVGALRCNGFKIRYLTYSSRDGFELSCPLVATNSLLWVVAKKEKDTEEFIVPQQTGWQDLYSSESVKDAK